MINEEVGAATLLRELSKEVCLRCDNRNVYACFNCKSHRLINQTFSKVMLAKKLQEEIKPRRKLGNLFIRRFYS